MPATLDQATALVLIDLQQWDHRAADCASS